MSSSPGRTRLRAVTAKPDVDALVERARGGDREALDAVLRLLIPRVRTWLYHLLGPRADLDEATQEALFELVRSIPRFEGRSKLTTYAHRICVRVAYRHFSRRHVPLELVAPPLDEVDPESRAMGREALRRLYRALEQLPEKRRVAFVLCAVEGLTPGEAARVQGVSGLAMRSRLFHARRQLLERLGDDPYVAALTDRVRPGDGGAS